MKRCHQYNSHMFDAERVDHLKKGLRSRHTGPVTYSASAIRCASRPSHHSSSWLSGHQQSVSITFTCYFTPSIQHTTASTATFLGSTTTQTNSCWYEHRLLHLYTTRTSFFSLSFLLSVTTRWSCSFCQQEEFIAHLHLYSRKSTLHASSHRIRSSVLSCWESRPHPQILQNASFSRSN